MGQKDGSVCKVLTAWHEDLGLAPQHPFENAGMTPMGKPSAREAETEEQWSHQPAALAELVSKHTKVLALTF